MTRNRRRSPAAGSQLSLALAAICFAATLFLFSTAQAQEAPAPEAELTETELREAGLVRLSDIADGTLAFKSSEPGWYVPAPRLATHVEMEVAGPIVRATVTQRFENPSEGWVEGRYLFPLPEDAGVDGLRMMIGDRLTEGEIQERALARATYERARAEGRRASLVEQERPNMFTTSVANIGPGETIVIQIEYQGTARMDGGDWELRFPMVVAPRFNPEGDPLQLVHNAPDPVPDRERITAPVVHPHAEPDESLRLPVRIAIDLKAGFALGAVESLHHAVSIEREGAERARIALANDAVPANRDFVLRWRAADPDAPQLALFRERVEGEDYILAVVSPPAELGETAPRRARETIFVIDNSGSMAGASMAQARAALDLALQRLEPGDAFNVIRFDDTFERLFDEAVAANRTNVATARKFVGGLRGEGGTQMLPAMQAALADRTPDPTRVRQVVFLTDGAIGDEARLFAEIDENLAASRLFPVGIGSAPNTYFMSRAARLGRGTFTHIGAAQEVETRMAALFQALERSVMTNVDALFPEGALAEVWPAPLPDLYYGEPVMFTARAGDLGARVILEGELAGQTWREAVRLSEAAPAAGVARLWARDRIAGIEELRFQNASRETIDRQVLDTALAFGLVTRLTSLVAVDKTPARPDGEALHQRDVPLMLPEGWDFEAVYGETAALQGLSRAFAGIAQRQQTLMATAPAPAQPQADPGQGLALPGTASPARIAMIAGLALLAIGLAAIWWAVWSRRRP